MVDPIRFIGKFKLCCDVVKLSIGEVGEFGYWNLLVIN